MYNILKNMFNNFPSPIMYNFVCVQFTHMPIYQINYHVQTLYYNKLIVYLPI